MTDVTKFKEFHLFLLQNFDNTCCMSYVLYISHLTEYVTPWCLIVLFNEKNYIN